MTTDLHQQNVENWTHLRHLSGDHYRIGIRGIKGLPGRYLTRCNEWVAASLLVTESLAVGCTDCLEAARTERDPDRYR